MAKYVIQEETLNNIGDAIREKTGRNYKIPPAQMPTEIKSILSNNISPITITANGTYNPPAGVDGYAPVVVELPIENGTPVDISIFEDFYEDLWRDENYIWRYDIRNWADSGSIYLNNIRDWVFDNFRNEIREYAAPLGLSGRNVCERFCYNNTHIDGLEIRVGDVENYIGMFEGCTNLKHFEFYKNTKYMYTICYLNNMFKNCHNYRLFSDFRTYPDTNEPYDPSQGIPAPNQFEKFVGGMDIEGIFNGCYSLRRIPNWGFWCDSPTGTIDWNGALRGWIVGKYVDSFRYCHALDNIQNLPPTSLIAMYTDSIFYNAFTECFRLNKMTFLKHKETGEPLVVKWAGQTIDLSKYVGYAYRKQYDGKDALFGFNAYLSNMFEIKDEESYLKNKDEIRSYTYNVGYSRYNKTSAIETIDSLPDTSAFVAETGRTNTIKFTGIAGEFTDGGAINTLSDTDIAVAAAKGWTVAYV